MKNLFGIHFGNNPQGNRQMSDLWACNFHNYVGLHNVNYDEMSEARQRYANALIEVRFYHPKWSDLDPVEWARECADWANRQSFTSNYTPANEMNLSVEGGGDSQEWYTAINNWLTKWAVEFRRLVPNPVLHWPALAYGHNEDEYGYNLCKESLQHYDVVDYHPYWPQSQDQLVDPTKNKWYAYRFVQDRKTFFSDKPVFISEFGNFDTIRPTTPVEYSHFWYSLYQYDWVLGACAFIWDDGGDHGHNRFINNSELVRITKDTYKPISRPSFVKPEISAAFDMVDELPKNPLPPELRRPLSQVDSIVFHHEGRTTFWSDNPTEVKALIHRGADYHVNTKKWPRYGYSYVIDKLGRLYWTNSASETCYHAGNTSMNHKSVGVLFPQDGALHGLTDAQLSAALWLKGRLGRATGNKMKVYTHREVRDGPTECPGSLIQSQVDRWLR